MEVNWLGPSSHRDDMSQHEPSQAINNDVPPAVMGFDAAAAYIGVAPSTLRTWRSRRPGFGPRALVIGGVVRYRVTELDAWLEQFLEDEAGHVLEESRRGKAPYVRPDAEPTQPKSRTRASRMEVA